MSKAGRCLPAFRGTNGLKNWFEIGHVCYRRLLKKIRKTCLKEMFYLKIYQEYNIKLHYFFLN